MWNKITEYFEDSPQRLKIAEVLIRHGFHIEAPGVIKCGEIRIPLKAIGDSLKPKIDRRTVRAVTEHICENPELFEFFRLLRPAGSSLEKVSKIFGYGVITIYVEAPEKSGILSTVTATIAGKGITIRQVVAEDVAIYENPCLKVITEEPLPGSVIEILSQIEGVKQVIIER